MDVDDDMRGNEWGLSILDKENFIFQKNDYSHLSRGDLGVEENTKIPELIIISDEEDSSENSNLELNGRDRLNYEIWEEDLIPSISDKSISFTLSLSKNK